MAFENVDHVIPGLVASADLSADQFKVITVDSGGKAALETGAGAKFDGILQDKPLADQAASVAESGVSKALAGATVAPGDLLMVDATSRLVPATATNFAGARALTGAAAGELISVLLRPYGTV